MNALAFEREEDEEGKVILLLGGVVDMAKETEMVVRAWSGMRFWNRRKSGLKHTKTVVILCHHVGERKRDIPACNDFL